MTVMIRNLSNSWVTMLSEGAADADGNSVGTSEGPLEGMEVDGMIDTEGPDDGNLVSPVKVGLRLTDGLSEGLVLGLLLGIMVGWTVGVTEGNMEGSKDGSKGDGGAPAKGSDGTGVEIGVHPHSARNTTNAPQKASSMNPFKPANSKLKQVTGSSPAMLTMTSGFVTRIPSPQILHDGKPGLGGSGGSGCDGMTDGD